jgi:hypothetical protein
LVVGCWSKNNQVQQYTKIMAMQKQTEDNKLEAKMQYVLDLWKLRVEWWNTEHLGIEWTPEVLHFLGHEAISRRSAFDFTHPISWKEELERKRTQIEQDRLQRQLVEPVQLHRVTDRRI